MKVWNLAGKKQLKAGCFLMYTFEFSYTTSKNATPECAQM